MEGEKLAFDLSVRGRSDLSIIISIPYTIVYHVRQFVSKRNQIRKDHDVTLERFAKAIAPRSRHFRSCLAHVPAHPPSHTCLGDPPRVEAECYAHFFQGSK